PESRRLSGRVGPLFAVLPLDEPVESFAVREPDPDTLIPFLREMEFSNLLRRAAAKLGVDVEASAAPAAPASVKVALTESKPPAPPPVDTKTCPGAVIDRAARGPPLHLGPCANTH